ncbi:SIS domain-containing protein, partial [Candidatus Pelagibacter sp.]|nr:SIS domain-containing protein [Candidatus Pelagibacter sp.]
MNKKNFFLINYYNNFKKLLSPSLADIDKMLQVQEILKIVKKKNKKILIFGNGGSASIASHVSVDLIKNVKIKCINFNEANLLTCFSNDFGYENWMKKAVEYYGDKGDVLIAISSSGQSKNIN